MALAANGTHYESIVPIDATTGLPILGGWGEQPAGMPFTDGQGDVPWNGQTPNPSLLSVMKTVVLVGLSTNPVPVIVQGAPTPATNLLKNSGNLAASSWSPAQGVTVTAGQADPNGGTTAFRLQYTGTQIQGFNQQVASLPTNGLASFWIKTNGASTTQQLTLYGGSSQSPNGTNTVSATSTWQRVAVQLGNQQTFNINAANGALDIMLWQPMYEDKAGSTPSTYVGT